MGIMNLFKKPEPVVKVVEKIVEKEVQKPSRFTFAHDKNITVQEYALCTDNTVVYGQNESSCTRFIFEGYSLSDTSKIYPVYQLPVILPTTKLVSPKKVICIGSIVTNLDNTIIGIYGDNTGMNMEDVIHEIGGTLPTAESLIVPMIREKVIIETDIEGDVGISTFKSSVSIDSMIKLITNY